MNKRRTQQINLMQLAMYVLKRCWLPIICAAVGFVLMYTQAIKKPDTYTASGTMYITNGNPNLINYGNINVSDMSASVQLINIYNEALKQPTVTGRALIVELEELDPNGKAVLDEAGEPVKFTLSTKYLHITESTVRGSISMRSQNETPFVQITCKTGNRALSRDICRAVLLVAPDALKDIVGAGEAKVQTYPDRLPGPDPRSDRQQGMNGALIGAAAALALLVLLYLLNRKVTNANDLTDNYTLPILSSIKREKEKSDDPGLYLLGEKSPMETLESYAKLRMNLFYTLVDRPSHAVIVTSAISGEGKSTIAANLAISCANSGKSVLLVDADMRRACQQEIFHYDPKAKGLSNVLAGNVEWQDAVLASGVSGMSILPAGSLPPNPAELLESRRMEELLNALNEAYDLILLDAPPINIVSDPLALSSRTAGAIFVVRQNFSDHREIRRALNAVELTDMNILGFVFYGENLRQGNYYSRKYYRNYYHKYDSRGRSEQPDADTEQTGDANPPDEDKNLTREANSDQGIQVMKEETTYADEKRQDDHPGSADPGTDPAHRVGRSRNRTADPGVYRDEDCLGRSREPAERNGL